MSNHRACCCGPGPCVCTGCDHGTSYLASAMQWAVQWNYDPKTSNPCVRAAGCVINDEEPVVHDVQVTASYSFRSGPVTRVTDALGNCCYRRAGTCDVTYSVTIVAYAACCQNPGTCTVTRTFNGASSVPYVLTVTPYCWQSTTCNWLHTVSVCPVSLGLAEFIGELSSADCAGGPLDCENLPLDRLGLLLNGGLFQWRTDYKALSSIVWPSDYISVAKCPASAIPVQCTFDHVAVNPPFGLAFVPVADYQTPTICPMPANAQVPYYGNTEGNCEGFDNNTADPCLGGYTIDEPCCFKEYTANANPPLYT